MFGQPSLQIYDNKNTELLGAWHGSHREHRAVGFYGGECVHQITIQLHVELLTTVIWAYQVVIKQVMIP